MLDHRHGVDGLLAKGGRVGRHVTPANNANTTVAEHTFGDDATLGLVIRALGRKEKHSDSEIGRIAQGRTELFSFGQKNPVRQVGGHTGAITSLAVCVHRTAVGYVVHRIESKSQDAVAGFPLDVGNDTNSTGISLQPRLVQCIFDFRTLQVLTHD